jgi:hypothetical protein
LTLSSADMKNEWTYTSTRPTRFPGLERDHFTFFYIYKLRIKLISCMVLLSGLAER